MLPETLVANDYCGRVDKEVAPSNAIDISESVIIVCAAWVTRACDGAVCPKHCAVIKAAR